MSPFYLYLLVFLGRRFPRQLISAYNHHMKPTALIFTTSEGHYSLSKAVEAELEKKYTVIEVKDSMPMGHGYVFLYRWFPHLFKFPYLLSKQSQLTTASKMVYNQRRTAKFKAFIEQHQPEVCVSTYFMCTHTLVSLKKFFSFTVINIVANPRTLHPLEFCEEAINCVFDETALAEAKKLAPTVDTRVTGWFVRPEFEASFDREKVRQQLHLDPDLLTITIVAGSEGNHKALSILPHIIKLNKPVQVIVICGSNSILLSQVKKIAAKNHSQVKVVVLGFTTELAQYLQAADLVVGKAGPNTLFETVATETPFFAISHIAGQEDGNLDIIKEYQLGYVEENIEEAVKLLKEIIDQPEKLAIFKKPLSLMAKKNKRAKELLSSFLSS